MCVNMCYPSSEHAYQAAKTLDKDIRHSFSIMMKCDLARNYGGIVTLRPDWDNVRIQVMEDVLRSKFTLSKGCRARLIATGDTELVEGGDWHDNFWGDCWCEKCKHIEGQNHLGKLLMKIRKELK